MLEMLLQRCCRLAVVTPPRRFMSGHSKWQNIRHQKAANDAARSKTFTKLTRMMKLAIKDGNGNDPKLNIKFAHVLEQARRAKMPGSTIDNVLSDKTISKESMQPLTVEVKGPGGCFLILECLTDNVKRTKQNVRLYVKRNGAMVVDNGARHAFQYKGVINVNQASSKDKLETLEQAVDVAIEVGAEDVVEVNEDDSGSSAYQFLCQPEDFYQVKKQIMEQGLEVLTSGLQYIPQRKTQLSDEDLFLMTRLADILDDDPDIIKCYDNIE